MDLTNRNLEVAEVFGLGIDDKKPFCFDNDFEVNAGVIVYLTSDRGSGKSCILNEFKKEFQHDCINVNESRIRTLSTDLWSLLKSLYKLYWYL